MRAQQVHALARRLAGDGDGLAARSARLAVSRSGELEQSRAAGRRACGGYGRHGRARASFGAEADVDRDACGAQPRVPCAGDFGIGIFQRRDDARDAGGDDGVGAGRRSCRDASRARA